MISLARCCVSVRPLNLARRFDGRRHLRVHAFPPDTSLLLPFFEQTVVGRNSKFVKLHWRRELPFLAQNFPKLCIGASNTRE